MPREVIRKRGKRKPKTDADEKAGDAAFTLPVPLGEEEAVVAAVDEQQEGMGGEGVYQADWITPAGSGMGSIRERVEGDAPWGFVDPEVKAYFKTIDERMKAFEELGGVATGEDAEEENEDRQLLVGAALTELRGKELQVATDSDCALIVERMIWNMGDFGRRVFADALMGNYEKLIQHRFGSHVVQTLLTLAALTIDREVRGIFPPQQAQMDPSEGVLPFMTDSILAICKELLPTLPSLIQSPFSSHPIRVLLLLLSGRPIQSSQIRSKRSNKFAKSHGTHKNVVQNDNEVVGEDESAKRKSVPPAFAAVVRELWEAIRERVGPNELRALGVGSVAGPVVQMLIELEADGGQAETPGSLMDSLMSGLITSIAEDPSTTPGRTDYLELLLRDSTGSHLFELLLRVAPDPVFRSLWKTYFVGRVGKLSVHPVANFVVAKAVARLGEEGLGEVLVEGTSDWVRGVKRSRTGVIKAVVDRAAALKVHCGAVADAIFQAFEIKRVEDRTLLVPCVMSLKPLKRYRKAAGLPAPEGEEGSDAEPEEDEPEDPLMPDGDDVRLEGEAEMTEAERISHRRRMGRMKHIDPLEPNMQGALLLQAILRLPSPHNEIVVSSLLAQPMDVILRYTHHPISSRIFDVLIESPTVSFKSKRNTLLAFTNATKWFELVDDRIGSRVGERLWEGCDGFLKEKIAKTLIPFEQALSQSQFGRFFGRKLNLNLYRRKPDEWRKSQIPLPPPPPPQGPAAPAAPASVAAAGARREAPDANAPKKRKRAAERAEQPQDEIDLLFAAAPPAANSSHSAPAASRPAAAVTEEVDEKKKRKKDKTAALESELGDVLGAIKASTGKKEKKVKKQSKEGGEDGEGERKEKKKRRKEEAEA